MKHLVIVNTPGNWPLNIPDVEVVAARQYLSDIAYSKLRKVKIFNLCRSYRYQSEGYYVSLLAEARGHKPVPSVLTIQDLKSQTMVRFVSDDLNAIIQKSLKPLQTDHFTLSIYFGKNLAQRYDRLSKQLFLQFQAPMLRAQFIRTEQKWNLQSIAPIATNEIPEQHRDFVEEAARNYFEGRRPYAAKKQETRFDLAILINKNDDMPPSNERAIQKFIKAAEKNDFYVELIGKDDYNRLAEFDALFIRETTSVNHHTYQFARRAATEGLVVIDDPESILRCTNKVYLAEILERNNLAAPKTMIVSDENKDRIPEVIGLPCILKQPDSSFSQGVLKAGNQEELANALTTLFCTSDLLIAQEFLPTEFDWRIGILNQKPLYACKYYMAHKHWQIYNHKKSGSAALGNADTLPIDDVPEPILKLALKAANLIGNGLYGVDLKEANGKAYIIEVNDNPSIDSGVEDDILKEELYNSIMQEILGRIEAKKGMDSKTVQQ